jgi:sphingolipid delta-4 desaturase
MTPTPAADTGPKSSATVAVPLLGPPRLRVQRILAERPEIRQCMGRNPTTVLCIAALVALQLALAWAFANGPWWLLLITAYVVGASASHALFVLIHECTHKLVFRTKRWNLVAELFANLPLILPCAVSFDRTHLRHHAHLGSYPEDPDIPFDWEARLVGRSWWRKALWIITYPLWLVPRSMRTFGHAGLDRWVVANMAVQLAFNVAVWFALGPQAFFYLLASCWFSISLHPLGARWIQEHWMVARPQVTYSYYGPLNVVAFNMGYHNEHHDFPNVPWNRLPRVRRLGGPWYDGLVSHASWTALLVRFIFDPKFHLLGRMAVDFEAVDGEASGSTAGAARTAGGPTSPAGAPESAPATASTGDLTASAN